MTNKKYLIAGIVLLALTILGGKFLVGSQEIKSLIFLAILEFLAIFSIVVGIKTFLKLNFFNPSNFPKEILVRIFGQLVLGVHFLIGLSILGIYFAM